MLSEAVTEFFCFLVRIYQIFLSPLLGKNCRFYPGCSTYMILVLRGHGLLRGGWMGFKRILRCRPGNPGGMDFPPPSTL